MDRGGRGRGGRENEPRSDRDLDAEWRAVHCASIVADVSADCKEQCAMALKRCLPSRGEDHKICRLVVPAAWDPSTQEDRVLRRRLNDTEIPVLQGILVHWSPVFKTQLEGLWRTNDGIVTIEDFTSDIVELFVKFLYSGEVAAEQLAMEQLLELARMGNYYDIEELQLLCFAWMNCWAFRPEFADRIPTFEQVLRKGFDVEALIKLRCKPELLAKMEITLERFLEVNWKRWASPVCVTPLGAAKLFFPRQGQDALNRIGTLITTGSIPVQDLLDRGWTIYQLLRCGVPPSDEHLPEVPLKDLFKILCYTCGDREVAMDAVIETCPSVQKIEREQLTKDWFQTYTRQSHLKLFKAGLTIAELHRLGYTERQLRMIEVLGFVNGPWRAPWAVVVARCAAAAQQRQSSSKWHCLACDRKFTGADEWPLWQHLLHLQGSVGHPTSEDFNRWEAEWR